MNFVNLKLSTGLILLQKQIYRSHFYLRYLQLSHRALSSVIAITREFRQAARDSNNRDMTLSVEINSYIIFLDIFIYSFFKSVKLIIKPDKFWMSQVLNASIIDGAGF